MDEVQACKVFYIQFTLKVKRIIIKFSYRIQTILVSKQTLTGPVIQTRKPVQLAWNEANPPAQTYLMWTKVASQYLVRVVLGAIFTDLVSHVSGTPLLISYRLSSIYPFTTIYAYIVVWTLLISSIIIIIQHPNIPK